MAFQVFLRVASPGLHHPTPSGLHLCHPMAPVREPHSVATIASLAAAQRMDPPCAYSELPATRCTLLLFSMSDFSPQRNPFPRSLSGPLQLLSRK